MAFAKVNDTGLYSGASSASITVPATTIGNLLIATSTGLPGATFGTPTGGGTWAIAGGPAGGSALPIQCFYCICTSSVTSVGFTASGANLIDVEVAEFSGVGSSPLDLVGTNNGTGSPMVVPTLGSPAVANELFWVAGSGGNTTGSAVLDANTPTNGFSVGGLAGASTSLASGYLISTDSSAHSTTWPMSYSTEWGLVVVSFKPVLVTSTQGIMAAI